jgi:preprotein translocase subunit SecD
LARSSVSHARRALLWTTALVVVLVLGLAAAMQFSTASWKPKLALDLAGGTQIVLTPEVRPGQGTITDQTITNAIAIIRQRVDSSGSTEAEVTSEGGRNIVVNLPGDPAEQKQARALVAQSAQMRFRPVLVEAAAAPAPTATDGATPSAAPSDGSTPAPSGSASTAAPTATSTASAPGSAPASGSPTASTQGDRVPQALRAATSTPTGSATPSGTASAAASDPASSPAAAAPSPSATDASDLAQVTPDVQAAFAALDCSNPIEVGTSLDDDPKKPIVTCSTDGAAKYVLGPVEVEGTDIDTASAGLVTTSSGATTGEWAVNLSLDGAGRKAFATSSTRLYGLESPRNQFAIVLDGSVVSAPAINSPITDGNAQITGSFTQNSATTLANQLKFGALPISFNVQTEEQISAVLGSEQLQRGLLAGAIGLLLVVLYSLLQYRTLGLVTVGSLLVSGLINFLAIDLLSWYQGYRLSLAGVAGFIVSIGITADSFIVFFERVRDEVREGRSLTAAVETGWHRARRTIIISDAVNFLAAATLYFLAVGSVRGFAFTLGLTTLIDLLVVIGFTHPVVVMLARRKFFAQGHRLSGFDALHLGRVPAYGGRGRVRAPGERSSTSPAGASLAGASPAGASPAGRRTIAERRAEREAAEREGSQRQSAGALAGRDVHHTDEEH